MTKVEIGKTYNVTHSRKGTFILKVTDVQGEGPDQWVTGTITHGRVIYVARPDLGMGESVTIRASLATFTEVEA